MDRSCTCACTCKKDPIHWPKQKEGENMILFMAYVRQQRNALLDVALAALNRHTNQATYGVEPTLNREEVCEVAQYAQELRDVPQQKGFPHNVEWPKTPACLRRHVVE